MSGPYSGLYGSEINFTGNPWKPCFRDEILRENTYTIDGVQVFVRRTRTAKWWEKDGVPGGDPPEVTEHSSICVPSMGITRALFDWGDGELTITANPEEVALASILRRLGPSEIRENRNGGTVFAFRKREEV